MRSLGWVLALAIAVAALLPACGGDGESTTVTETVTTTEATTTTTTVTEATGTDGADDSAPTGCPPSTGIPPNITRVTVTGMGCEQAQGVIDAFGVVSKSFSAAGFECARTSGARLGGSWTCTSGERSFSFEFGD